MKRYLFITAGVFLTASADALIIVPTHIINGGVTSLAMVLSALLHLDVSVFVILIRVVLLILCGVFLGVRYVKGSMYSATAYLIFFTALHGLSQEVGLAYGGPLWLAVPLAGLAIGTGYSLCIANEATEVGFDALALIVHRKFPKIGLAPAMYGISVLVLLSGLLVFHWLVVLAGIALALIQAYTMDIVLSRLLRKIGHQEG